MVGYVRASFQVMSSVPDADIAIKLLDVDPAGRALNIFDSIKRLRYRDSVDAPTSISRRR